MRRADRLFQIVQLLRSGKLITARHLADTLEVSERTIYRDIAHLVGSGLPIDGEAGLGYLMRAGYDLPPLMFTTDEIVALTAGARMIRAWGGAAMVKGAEQALDKITSVLPDDTRARAEAVAIHARPRADMTETVRRIIDQLEAAVTRRERITMAYSDEAGQKTKRTVRPIGLWYWGPVWTLIGWCELRQDFRMFRLDRIGTAEGAGPFETEPGQSLQDFYAQQAARHGC
ncbi:YafY family transcriptional regulator [Rhodophyticola sp. CCM32]|uniref:helix-turn-helix transcriptional regulator n=1 Tax=Rhodophyticola sp. CCM32 TaxID=2916397 RepID=UPI00107EEAE7|nr:YafY family protein [Rhodophyticola sp. CCM32]QBX99451.1 YafY family transcriptional regulator [Rhodophyticola sp. CCM32]